MGQALVDAGCAVNVHAHALDNTVNLVQISIPARRLQSRCNMGFAQPHLSTKLGCVHLSAVRHAMISRSAHTHPADLTSRVTKYWRGRLKVLITRVFATRDSLQMIISVRACTKTAPGGCVCLPATVALRVHVVAQHCAVTLFGIVMGSPVSPRNTV